MRAFAAASGPPDWEMTGQAAAICLIFPLRPVRPTVASRFGC
ncbi:MAG: hypothetical protein WCD76_17830 [Pyrinomonadaceae bacterium]